MKLALLAMALAIPAHSWYPSSCCSGQDCKPIPCDQLVENSHGWVYLPTGNEFNPSQVHPSQDKDCHVCIGWAVGSTAKLSRCAFIQQGV